MIEPIETDKPKEGRRRRMRSAYDLCCVLKSEVAALRKIRRTHAHQGDSKTAIDAARVIVVAVKVLAELIRDNDVEVRLAEVEKRFGMATPSASISERLQKQ